MRRRILAFAALLALTACGKEPAAQDARQADQALARDNLDSNDLTAIDAASGADSNMAADIDLTANMLNVDDEAAPANRSAPRRTRSAPAESPQRDDSPPAANDTAPPETDDGAN